MAHVGAGAKKRKRAGGGSDGDSSASDWAPASSDEALEAADAATDSSLSGSDADDADGDAASLSARSDGGGGDTLDADDEEVIAVCSDADVAGPSGDAAAKKQGKKAKASAAEIAEEEALDAAVAEAAGRMITAALQERARQAEGVSLLHEARSPPWSPSHHLPRLSLTVCFCAPG
jgi:hypothetical protein